VGRNLKNRKKHKGFPSGSKKDGGGRAIDELRKGKIRLLWLDFFRHLLKEETGNEEKRRGTEKKGRSQGRVKIRKRRRWRALPGARPRAKSSWVGGGGEKPRSPGGKRKNGVREKKKRKKKKGGGPWRVG